MATPKVIALSGSAGSGKDTVGSILTRLFSFVRVSFADPMKQLLLSLDPKIDGHLLSGLVAVDGFDVVKQNPEVRRLLQRIGTEACKPVFGENIWIDLALKKMTAPGNYVVTDCRFESEAIALRAAGAVIWRIERPGAGLSGSLSQHSSERSFPSSLVDLFLYNNGTVEDLEESVALLVNSSR